MRPSSWEEGSNVWNVMEIVAKGRIVGQRALGYGVAVEIRQPGA
jgi:hypothetical protein